MKMTEPTKAALRVEMFSINFIEFWFYFLDLKVLSSLFFLQAAVMTDSKVVIVPTIGILSISAEFFFDA